MGDPTGFLKIRRKQSGYRPVEERINDYSEVEMRLPDEERRAQAARCMDFGVPFCHWACPVANVMPEWQDRLFRGDWEGAWALLQDTNPFPEFTGRVCPALCEASCVLGANDEPVTIRQNELAVIEGAWERGLVRPRPPKRRNGKKVAVVGAGPAGLSAAWFLNRAGFSVTVFEGDRKLGGYLRYGIPDFKLDKSFIDRRIALMEADGGKRGAAAPKARGFTPPGPAGNPRAGAFAPTAGTFAPAARTFTPTAGTFAPAVRTVTPKVRTVASAVRAFAPMAGTFAPAVRTVAPKVRTIASTVRTFAPTAGTGI